MENIYNAIITAASMYCVWTDWCCILHKEDSYGAENPKFVAVLKMYIENINSNWSYI